MDFFSEHSVYKYTVAIKRQVYGPISFYDNFVNLMRTELIILSFPFHSEVTAEQIGIKFPSSP